MPENSVTVRNLEVVGYLFCFVGKDLTVMFYTLPFFIICARVHVYSHKIFNFFIQNAKNNDVFIKTKVWKK